MPGDIDYTAMRFALDLLQLAAILVLGIYSWIVNGRKANRQAIEELAVMLQSQERRISVAESRIDAAPTHGDLGQLYERVNLVAQDISKLTAGVAAIEYQVRMVSEYLLTREKKGDGQ
jgi:hypothetical protein